MRRLVASLTLVVAASVVGTAADSPYRLIKEIHVGGEGGWDYISVDSAAHRLYVSHSTKVVVIDIDAGKVVGEIPGTDGVHGLAVAADLGRGFTSNGRANTSTIIDLKTLKPLGTVATGKHVTSAPIGGGADGAAYDPATGYLFASNGEGTVTVLHVDTADRLSPVQTLPSQASGRTMILDPVTHNIYVPAATLQPAPAGGGRAQPVSDTLKVLVFGMK